MTENENLKDIKPKTRLIGICKKCIEELEDGFAIDLVIDKYIVNSKGDIVQLKCNHWEE